MARKQQASADTARKIWLAGIGAYGRAFTEAQEQVAKLTGESARVFDDLVAKGEEIERKVDEGRRKMAERMGPAGVGFEERIKRMREKIGAIGDDDNALEARVAALEARVAKLEGQAEPKPRAKRKTKKKKA
ncbi:MAG: phasin family protein [Parvularculaceae bacterium]|nr:phasin family protein [Parvularculaceae bacterium]